MPNELKPCPFCNSTEHLKIMSCDEDCCENEICIGCDKQRYTVCCSAREGGCGAICGYKETKEKAIECWNGRVDNAE